MTLNDLVKHAYENAKAKGWHESERSALEMHMLIVSEIAEATESVRASKPAFYFDGTKPEGELIELADAIIRICDYVGSKGWDLDEAVNAKLSYNLTRSHRHGNKSI
jgi:hypothetical protein